MRLPDQQTGDLADALGKFNWDDEAVDSAEISIDHDAEMADSVSCHSKMIRNLCSLNAL